jgi:chaperonin cofactor prefoldin
MPAKTTAKAKPQDLETVVQIALDAADAAMDVTSEFARISTEFQKAKNTFGRLEKTVKITALAVGGLLFVGVLLVGLLLARTADKMNVLTATNTELLTVFTENISMMNDGVGSLQGPFSQLATLQEQLETMAPKIAEISAASDAVTEKLSGMDQAFEEIKLVQSDQAGAVTAQIDTSLTSNLADILDQLDERISMLNGELAMATTENIDSALKEQAMLFSEVTTEFMAVIREGLNQDDPEADRKMQALMDI